MVITIFAGLKSGWFSEYFNKERENMKNKLEGINARWEDAEEWISDQEDRVMGSNQAEEQKEKKNLKNESKLKDLLEHIKKTTTQ